MNRIRNQSYRLVIDSGAFNKKTVNDLRSSGCVLNAVANDIKSLNYGIST